MHPLNTEQKTTVLLSALEERYTVMRTIRDRVQSVGVWALGLLLTAGGWFIQSDIVLTSGQKLLYLIGVVVAIAVLRFKYLDDLCTGFQAQQRVAVRLEKTLGLFTPGIFDGEADSVYPPKWESAGNINGGGKFFNTSYLLLYVGAAFLLLAILLNGCGQYDKGRFHHAWSQIFISR